MSGEQQDPGLNDLRFLDSQAKRLSSRSQQAIRAARQKIF